MPPGLGVDLSVRVTQHTAVWMLPVAGPWQAARPGDPGHVDCTFTVTAQATTSHDKRTLTATDSTCHTNGAVRVRTYNRSDPPRHGA